jgi:hypothetical protein
MALLTSNLVLGHVSSEEDDMKSVDFIITFATTPITMLQSSVVIQAAQVYLDTVCEPNVS